MTRNLRSTAPHRGGFSLVELAVALFVVSLLLSAIVVLFNFSGRIARVQTQLSDMQQSLRIAQYDIIRHVRMAGRGGLPRGLLPQGIAVSVRNEIPDSGDQARVAVANAGSPEAVAGSDILSVRGVFTSPIYQINPQAGSLVLEGTPPVSGRISVTNPSPSGVPQDLQPLIDAVNDGLPEALLMVSPLGFEIYAVVELDPGHANTDVSDPSNITLQFKISGGTNTTGYLAISPGGGYPTALQAVAALGILEEHRYYVRKEFRVPGDANTEPAPRLARARVYPGSDNPHAGANSNLRLDIADNILDLQVAIGVDTDNNQQVDETNPPSSNDDWVFNSADDDQSDAAQVSSWNQLPDGEPTRLYYLRLTTLARTGRRDVGYVSPPLPIVEDRDYGEDASPSDAEKAARGFRRRLLQTVIDLRNIS